MKKDILQSLNIRIYIIKLKALWKKKNLKKFWKIYFLCKKTRKFFPSQLFTYQKTMIKGGR